MTIQHRTTIDLEMSLEELTGSPRDRGVIALIVRRPSQDEREVLKEAELTLEEGLAGDRWSKGESPNPESQMTVMNSRVIDFLAGSSEGWPLAGDQLYVDLDLGVENLPTGTKLSVGSAVIEVTAPPHTGCAKFAKRFGMDAARFVNSNVGRHLRLRGLNARVIKPGQIRQGDTMVKV